MKNRVRLLGTGGSFAIPSLGCKCDVCQSTNPKNKRLRTSCLVEYEGRRILIDTSPDVRQSLLEYGIDHIDMVLITHHHEDHTGGANDLRSLYFKNNCVPFPLYLSAKTLEVFKKRFDYLMDRFKVIVLEKERGEIDGFRYFTYSQADAQVTGFRFSDFAYVTDIKDYNDTIFEELRDLDTLVLGAIHQKGTRMHFSIDEAIEFGRKCKAKRVMLTHLSHEVEHEKINKSLPDGFELGYDGKVIDV